MRTIKMLSIFLLALGLVAVASCSSAYNKEGTGEYLDDSVVTTKVKAAILNLSVAEINVETFKGVVQLSGFVKSREDINTAVKLASKVPGVISVKNDMQLKSGAPSPQLKN
ncbi:BON domain-containing protein [Shewanella sp. SW36]|uniref:BON domain-containing protein n=1 Tax=unclassified Shewanella TaxID=196818 RepID=UPI0021DAB433|nr:MULTISPECIES: BON domain-containing protein [unclassified Shewanella]MCU7974140.1 BON domain-containing protein [Shewanella sp. SW36]MCU7989750.1 BON domain-containing protein [Shewanella sp. SW1]MCU8050172.1 BON domain-containing protein [Shewanella sp. SM43]